MAECQDSYPYTEAGFGALHGSLSDTRLSTYLSAAGRNRERALQYYLWNARLSKAVRFPLEVLEVTVRNRIHNALKDRWGDDWPNSDKFLAAAASKTRERIRFAQDTVGKGARADRVVAALTFGFWPALLKDRYVETLWRGRLEKFFPNLPAAATIESNLALLASDLESARELRNRIGHLEPIFNKDVSVAYSKIVRAVAYACRNTSGWMRHHSTVNETLRAGPEAVLKTPIVFGKAIRQFLSLPPTTTIDVASVALQAAPARIALVTGLPGGPVIIANEDIGCWLSQKAADGIVELDSTTLAEISASFALAPVVSRRCTARELIINLSPQAGESLRRHAVITENGRRGEEVLGLIDVLDLL